MGTRPPLSPRQAPGTPPRPCSGKAKSSSPKTAVVGISHLGRHGGGWKGVGGRCQRCRSEAGRPNPAALFLGPRPSRCRNPTLASSPPRALLEHQGSFFGDERPGWAVGRGWVSVGRAAEGIWRRGFRRETRLRLPHTSFFFCSASHPPRNTNAPHIPARTRWRLLYRKKTPAPSPPPPWRRKRWRRQM